MLSELVTLSTPFIEVEATRASSHQKTYANIVLGRYSKHWEHKEYRRLPTRTASVIDGLLKVDPATRLGGHQRGPESIRVHPFFWGLSWEALESRTLVTVSSCRGPASSSLVYALTSVPSIVQPHSFICEERGAAVRKEFDNASWEPLVRNQRSVRQRGQRSYDAAAAAMDQMFDFSEW
ncbi:MAG: hypothetical protein SGPRY_003198 [Prymnesium sp.]